MKTILACKGRQKRGVMLARLVLLLCLCFFINSCGIYDRPNFSESGMAAAHQGVVL